jgi:hypothetical protein
MGGYLLDIFNILRVPVPVICCSLFPVTLRGHFSVILFKQQQYALRTLV